MIIVYPTFAKMDNNSFQMKQHHQDLLVNNKVYLLHNLRPTEEFWAALVEKGIYSSSMIEDIRVRISYKVSWLEHGY